MDVTGRKKVFFLKIIVDVTKKLCQYDSKGRVSNVSNCISTFKESVVIMTLATFSNIECSPYVNSIKSTFVNKYKLALM